ncbi:Flp family type IVb pilin [Eubacterium sp.]|uniref:Flp family type IVb pilin n=1 Tax=Eubacterium sp. TaxID=142586 RepID=UPI0025D67646|nr:Flp family type IVb pilin [Eubacterium sp.]MCR5629263.1 Flp family type IVb pilin [Eubacterium sp.]
MKSNIKSFLLNENGQSTVEYGLIIALIALVAVLALAIFGIFIRDDLYQEAVNKVPDA